MSDQPTADPVTRRRLTWEVWLVLGLSLGQSAVYSIISLIAKLTAGRPLAEQQATLNRSLSPRPYLDMTYQLADVVFTMVPAALALWLLWEPGRSVLARLGLDARRPGRDLAVGALLTAMIGIPGIGLYLVGRAAGISAEVIPAGLSPVWWAIPVLVLQAVKNAVIEEVVVVGYLMDRLPRLGWSVPMTIAASALLRGSYHLYQGFSAFLGNAVMGVVFALVYRRTGRLMPLLVAHTLLDVASFVGYHLFADLVGLR